MIYLLIISLIVFYVYYRYVVDFKLKNKPTNYPTLENIQKATGRKKRLVCLGDSNTQGNMSFNWVKEIAELNKNLYVFNAGINADLTFSLLKRVDEIVSVDPDFITILIGTNDLNATLNLANLKRYRERNKIGEKEEPGLESFGANYSLLIKKLKERTKAKIVLITIPLLTENLGSTYNLKVTEYCEVIKELGKTENLHVIKFNEEQKKLLTSTMKTSLVYKNSRQMMTATTVMRNIFGLSFNQVSRIFKTETSPDFIHLN